MGSPTRILLVDDEPAVLEVFSQLLQSQGYAVATADTGAAALAAASDQRPDLIILDIALPDLSGIEVCRLIKSDPALTDTFIVVLSGAATGPAATIKGLATGADDYISKSVHPSEILARIRTIVRLRDTTVALRQGERHYRGLVQLLPDAVLTTDQNHRILSVNPQAVSMLGCASEQDLLGLPLTGLVETSDRARMLTEMRVTLETGAMRNAEYSMVRNDGDVFPADLSAAVTRRASGEISGFVVVVRDSSDRKRSERLLQERVQLNRRIISTAMDGFWMTDTSGRLLDVNEAYCSMSGYSLAELLTMKARNLEVSGAPRRLSHSIRKVLAGGSDRFETQHRRKDGRIIDVEVSTTSLQSAEGVLCVFLRNVTERKRQQQNLSDALELNESIMSASAVGIMAFRASGQCIFSNDAAVRMLKCVRTDLPDFLAFAPWRRASLTSMAQRALRTGKVCKGEAQYIHADGKESWLECHMDSFVINGEAHLLAILSDATERKRAEQELKRLPGRILQAQEMERLRVSRDLHDGVNQIIASAKMRLHKVLEDAAEGFRPAAREILARCERLLVQALEENRRIAHDLRPTDLDDLGFESACRHFINDFSARTGLPVTCAIAEFGTRLPEPVETSLFRILQEALGNIQKHAQASGVEVRISGEQNAVALTVRDNGRGIQARNGSGEKRRRGEGLGLLGMKERASLLGGDLRLVSSPGCGTTISVTVPFTSDSMAVPATPPCPAPKSSRNG